MIQVYTDAAVSASECIVTSCIVLKDDSFMGHSTFDDCPNGNTLCAEVYGCVEALKYMAKVCDCANDDNIVMFTDSVAVLESVNQAHEKYPDIYVLDKELQRLVAKYKVKVTYIRGHQDEHNPNKFVDYTARHFMRAKDKSHRK